MKNLKFIRLLFIALGVSSCSLDDDQQDCITGPVGYNVEFIDAESGENVYRNNRFQAAQLRVTDEDNKLVTYRFITEQEKTYIQVNLGFEKGDKVITMKLNDETSVDFKVTISQLQEACTTYYISKLEIPVYGYDESGTPGVIRVPL